MVLHSIDFNSHRLRYHQKRKQQKNQGRIKKPDMIKSDIFQLLVKNKGTK